MLQTWLSGNYVQLNQKLYPDHLIRHHINHFYQDSASNSLNTFKHNVKKHLTWITCVYVHMCICMYICLCVRGYMYIKTYGYILVCFLFDLSILMFFFSFSRLHFSLIFVLTQETITEIRRFFPCCASPATFDASFVCSNILTSTFIL